MIYVRRGTDCDGSTICKVEARVCACKVDTRIRVFRLVELGEMVSEGLLGEEGAERGLGGICEISWGELAGKRDFFFS